MRYRQSATTMKKQTLPFLATAATLAVGFMVMTGCRVESPTSLSSETIADSVSGFSSQQGTNGWFYGYWDRTADLDKNYNQETDFQLFKHFGSDPKNMLSGRRELTIGKLWNLQDGVYYTSLWAEGGHPNSTTKLREYAQVEQWAVRRSVSTANGTITVSGYVGKSCRGERIGEVVARR
jgi:hypothetical protein